MSFKVEKYLKEKLAEVQRRKTRLGWVQHRIAARKAITSYGNYLASIRESGRILPRVQMSGGNWQPQPNMCHHNVTQYCEFDRSFKPVRGWLYFDLSSIGCLKFVAHSVLRFPDGGIYDITPVNASSDYPFIPCGLSNVEFAAMATVCINGEINVQLKNA